VILRAFVWLCMYIRVAVGGPIGPRGPCPFPLSVRVLSFASVNPSARTHCLTRTTTNNHKKSLQAKKSSHVLRKLAKRKGDIDSHLEEQFASGRLLACVTSRPGQSGRADGYILEGKELEFYQKMLARKKKGQK
jgi:hypothetical protein